jgi:hypothetical protein
VRADQAPALLPSALKFNLAFTAEWLPSTREDAVICTSVIVPSSIPSGATHPGLFKMK